nr:MAG TPA: hypothetical protein [Bacteriophage sp.]
MLGTILSTGVTRAASSVLVAPAGLFSFYQNE